MKELFLFIELLAVVYLTFSCSSGTIRVEATDIPEKQQVDVMAGNQLFTSFCYSDTLKKPILFPVKAANGITVTRGFPIAPRKGEQADHPHQAGYWFTYGDVNGINFWGYGNWIPDSVAYKYGTIRLKNIEKIENQNDKGILTVNQEWVKSDGTVMMDEQVVFTFSAGKDYRIIDRFTTFTARLPEISFPDTKEGATGIRVARFLDFPDVKTSSMVDESGKITKSAVPNEEGVTGNYLSSEGIIGSSVWGTRAKWMELYGFIGQDTISIVFMDHPSSFNFPTYWHARDYGLFAANPFGVKDFTGGKDSLNFRFKEGEKISFKHRIYIKSGKGFPASEIEKEWLGFSSNQRP